MSSPGVSDPYDYIVEHPDLNKLKFQENETARIFNVNDFNYIDTLGRGIFIVKLFEYKPKKKFRIAIKLIPIQVSRYQHNSETEKLKRLIREIQNLQKVTTHPNIINLYGLCLHNNEAWICMELMDMSLHEFYLLTHKYHPKFPEYIVGHICVKIIDALSYCKYEKIIHRDLKPRNVLLNRMGEIKLCDFGESRVIEESVASSYVGTIQYWPPERFMHLNQSSTLSINNNPDFSYDIRADIWSLGITLLEVVNGKLPYMCGNTTTDENSTTCLVTLQSIILNINGDDLVEHCCEDKYTIDLKAFVKRCLSRVEDRPQSYNELKNMSFYSQNKDQKGSQIISPVINDFLLEKSSSTNQKSIFKNPYIIALILFCAVIFFLLLILMLSHFIAKPDTGKTATSPTSTISFTSKPTTSAYPKCQKNWSYFPFTNSCYYICWKNLDLAPSYTLIAIGLYTANASRGEVDYKWIDGTDKDYTNWEKIPDADKGEHCVFKQQNGKWNVSPCNSEATISFVCKHE